MKNLKQNLLSICETGEPGMVFITRQGRRIRSTRLTERTPAMVKLGREHSTKTGKGSKTVRSNVRTAYLESLKRNAGASDDALTCVRRLQTVWNLSSDNRKAKHLFRMIRNEELWIAAYRKLASNKGALTPGGAGGTIDGTSIKSIRKLIHELNQNTYVFGTSRRVNIPKPKGGTRPLGIPEFRDRLSQEVLRTLLECIYEPRFVENSHGFRPGRSQHTCLRQIRRDFGATKWVIEGDISKCFDTLDHNVVRNLLTRTIEDRRFVELLVKGLKSKVLMPNNVLEWMDSGAPQGGVCSPLLSNIVLHQLDRFILRLKRVVDKGKARKRNPEYVKLMNRRRYYRGSQTSRDAARAARRIPSTLTNDPDFRRLNYVRYADDFIVGVTGPRKLAARIKGAIASFLKQRLRLELSHEKTAITQLSKNGVRFLGVIIKRGPTFMMKHTQHYGNTTRHIKRIRTGGLIIHADISKVVQGLAHKGFCRQDGPVPNFRLLHQPQSYAIQRANSILRGLNQYFRVCDNRRPAVSYFNYLIRYSIAKMFAAKFKLRSLSHVFKIAGKDLGKPLKSKRTIGSSDDQQTKHAREAGSRVKGAMPKMLYTKYNTIPKPDIQPLAKQWTANGSTETHVPWPITRWTEFNVRGRMALSASCSAEAMIM